ncbi:MAG: hypothetical protein IKZ20_03350, partial [Bacteroidaceae bacterium]|nr:hypothetical protein [Bacteroidaceae bacterium]
MQPVHKFPVLLPIFLFADKVSARGEQDKIKLLLFFLPSRCLTWTQVKVSARRAQNKTKTEFLVFYAEPKPNLREAKVSKARARQNKNRENFSA